MHIDTVDFTPIPEPMTLSLLALGGVMLLRKHR
ncbi:MAG: PEP-CTERM sorting domain-containing protein [Sedimentisphaerales bacterium]|nr:PEP-CTERM sorting domain-containing protein [Sedimentisphaerales bacterium]